jgi:glycosyltransferase involved in cell wall biosynthesis
VDVYTGTLTGDELLREYPDVNIRTTVGLSGGELGRALQTADVLALPSLSEGFGHVILEGMACGLPVIATPHSCAPDVVIEGVHGFIVPIRDAHAIAARLEWAVNNRPDLADMGVAATRRAAHFTWDRFREGVAKAYLDMRFKGSRVAASA